MTSAKTQRAPSWWTVDFEAPYGPLGRTVEKLALARYQRNLIGTRKFLIADQVLGR